MAMLFEWTNSQSHPQTIQYVKCTVPNVSDDITIIRIEYRPDITRWVIEVFGVFSTSIQLPIHNWERVRNIAEAIYNQALAELVRQILIKPNSKL